MDCIFYEAFEEEQDLLKEFLPSYLKADFTLKTIQEDGRREPPADIISIRTQSVIPVSWSGQLRGILTRSVGYDHLIAYREKTKTETSCGYLPAYCSRAVAEQAIMMMFMIFRKCKLQMEHMKRFHRDGMTGTEAKGRNCLVIGVGNIGSEIVDIAKGIGMNVRGIDINQKRKDIEYVTLVDGLMWAHAAVCALPLTRLTENMLSYEALKHCRKGLVFLNIARGEIAPLKDLKKLLDEGFLGGLGCDVYDREHELAVSLRSNSKAKTGQLKIFQELKKNPACIFTPHNAFNTREATSRKARQAIQSIEYFIKRRGFPHPIKDPLF